MTAKDAGISHNLSSRAQRLALVLETDDDLLKQLADVESDPDLATDTPVARAEERARKELTAQSAQG